MWCVNLCCNPEPKSTFNRMEREGDRASCLDREHISKGDFSECVSSVLRTALTSLDLSVCNLSVPCFLALTGGSLAAFSRSLALRTSSSAFTLMNIVLGGLITSAGVASFISSQGCRGEIRSPLFCSGERGVVHVKVLCVWPSVLWFRGTRRMEASRAPSVL